MQGGESLNGQQATSGKVARWLPRFEPHNNREAVAATLEQLAQRVSSRLGIGLPRHATKLA